MPRKIIIDTDPGQDDAVAILLALASPELEVLGVIAVAGNVPLHHTLTNAGKILELAGRSDIPLYAGSSSPIRRTLTTAEHVHGETGLDGPDLPPPNMPIQDQSGIDYLIDTIRAAQHGEITLVMLGPLTDLAWAIRKAPDIATRLQEIVIMGGAYFEGGNVTPSAEFNIYVDPEAADIVFKSGANLTMLPLDATHQVRSTPQRIASLAKLPNRCGPYVAQMLQAAKVYDLGKYGWDGAPLHDPTTIAYLIQPTLFKGRKVNVRIETTSDLTLGATVVDWWQVTDRPPNTTFIREADGAGFYDLLTQRLAKLP
jgi:purine nucleosidase